MQTTEARGATHALTVHELIRGRLVLSALRARGRHDAIAELVDFLVHEGELPHGAREAAIEAAYERERTRPTGTEHGIALPHGVTEAVADEIAAIGLSQDGIPFDGLDGHPARIVVLVLSPPRLAEGRVHTLACLARLLCDAPTREALVLSPNREDALRLIQARCALC